MAEPTTTVPVGWHAVPAADAVGACAAVGSTILVVGEAVKAVARTLHRRGGHRARTA